MEYKAQLDTLAKIITPVAILIIAGVCFPIVKLLIASKGDLVRTLLFSGVLVLNVAVIIGCYVYAPECYRLDDATLSVVRPIGNVRVNLADISEIRPLADDEKKGMIRTFGVGGLFGYFGKFYAGKIGNFTLYGTQRKNNVLIVKRQGDKIVLTPDDMHLVEDVKAKLKQH
jgi:hypothetical protein